MSERTPEEVVMDVANNLDISLGPNIEQVLEELVSQLDERYEMK